MMWILQTQDAPYKSREALLDRLDDDLYRDAMALNTDTIAGGAVTATQIKAAYEPLNSKTDDYEYQIITFVNKILVLAGIDDTPSFTRSILVNANETIQVLVQAAPYLPADYVTTKILETLGDGDKTEDILNQMSADEIDRFAGIVSDAAAMNNDDTEDAETAETEG